MNPKKPDHLTELKNQLTQVEMDYRQKVAKVHADSDKANSVARREVSDKVGAIGRKAKEQTEKNGQAKITRRRELEKAKDVALRKAQSDFDKGIKQLEVDHVEARNEINSWVTSETAPFETELKDRLFKISEARRVQIETLATDFNNTAAPLVKEIHSYEEAAEAKRAAAKKAEAEQQTTPAT